jgi:hypothetical protein
MYTSGAYIIPERKVMFRRNPKINGSLTIIAYILFKHQVLC